MQSMLSRKEISEIRRVTEQFGGFLRNDPTGERMQEARNFLAKRPCWLPPQDKVWRTIKLGLHESGEAYDQARRGLEGAEVIISDFGKVLLNQETFTCALQVTELDLVLLSVGQLGFKEGALLRDICAKGIELGLQLCPAEVGPALRLQYFTQSRYECVNIAMEPIPPMLLERMWHGDRDRHRFIFKVFRGYCELWLGENCNIDTGMPRNFFKGDEKFVFAKPRR